MNAFCDVLVVGSGPAGLMAAKAAAESGARVILAELEPAFRRLGQLVGRDDRRHAGGRMGRRDSVDELARRATMSGFCRAPPSGATTTTTRSPALERVTDHKADARQGRAAPPPLGDPRQVRRAGDRRLRAAAGVSGQRPAGRACWPSAAAALCQRVRRAARRADRALHQQ